MALRSDIGSLTEMVTNGNVDSTHAESSKGTNGAVLDGPPAKNPFPMNFAELFKDAKQPAEDGRCEYSKPPNTKTLDLEDEDVDKVKDLWGFCLLGCFAGCFPGLKAIHNLVDSWKTKCTVLPHFNGWVVFQFESLEEMERVLAKGPYFVFGCTLLVRSIPENLCFRDEDYSVVPVWVQLQSIPL